jgi:hypothetical protein
MNTRRVGVTVRLGVSAAGYIGAGVNPLGPGPTGGAPSRVSSGTTGRVTGIAAATVGLDVRLGIDAPSVARAAENRSAAGIGPDHPDTTAGSPAPAVRIEHTSATTATDMARPAPATATIRRRLGG